MTSNTKKLFGKPITRRKLLKDSSMAAIASSLYFSLPLPLTASPQKQSKVVLIRDQNLLTSKGKLNEPVLDEMLDEAIRSLTGKEDSDSAWKTIIKPTDIVGIKSNVWSYLPTPRHLELTLEERAMQCGVDKKNISTTDRGVRSNPVFKNSTALINVRPMRTHAWSGVGSCIKNYIMFVSRPSSLHGDSCADLATVWNRPEVAGKTRLNILVMITPLFHGVGPHHFNRKYTWPYNGLVVGFDPVAVDSVGVRILMAQRKEYFKEDRPLSPPPKHIFLADTRHNLGTADINKIDLVKLGWKEGILI